MKKIIVSLLFLLIMTALPAQVKHRKSNSKDKEDFNAPFYGIVVGATAPTYQYSDNNLSELPSDFFIKPNIGVFVEIPIAKFFLISPEIMMVSKGHKTSYEYGKNPEGTPYNVTYQVNSKYASIRLPLIFNIPTSETISPFLFVAPDISYLLGGNISVTQLGLSIPEATAEIGKANMKDYDANVYFGIGLRLKFRFSNYFSIITRIDAGYNMGFINTYSDLETEETATPVNINAYNLKGTRYNRGFELNIHIGFSTRKKDCGCYEINKTYRTTPKPVNKKYDKFLK